MVRNPVRNHEFDIGGAKKFSIEEGPAMVGVDVPSNIFEFSPSRMAKTALVKSFYEKSKASFKKKIHEKFVF